MRSELFEETIKQHRDSLAEELLQLGKYREAQLVEWDIERNESDYEYYFNAGWSAQQSKIDELQKRVDLLEGKIKEALNTVYAMKGKADCDHLTDKEQSFVYGFGYELHEILKEEQALKGEK